MVCPCLGDRSNGSERKNVASGWNFFPTRLYANGFIRTRRDTVVIGGFSTKRRNVWTRVEMRFTVLASDVGGMVKVFGRLCNEVIVILYVVCAGWEI